MENKNIIYIIIAGLLWSLVPIFVSDLFSSISIIMIIFLRFFISGIILLLIGSLIVYFNNRYWEKQKISLKLILKSILTRNEKFYNIRYFTYLSLLGFFGVILQIIGYFLALKLTSVSFAMIGFQLSIIIIAVYEHGIRLEKLDIFKILYLIILIFCISIIIYVKSQEVKEVGTPELLIGGIYVLLFALCISLLNIGINRDSYSEAEIKLINKNSNYKIVRMLFKISLTFLIGIAFLFPFLLFIFFVPLEINLYKEIKLFFNQFANIWSILCNWEMILLIIFSTIIPYILIFIASFNWIPHNLSYGQWSSILSIIEPIGGLVFGVLFVNEMFPLGYLVIIVFLLIISILFRYINESRNKINAYILIGQKQGFMKVIQLQLLQLEGVERVRSLIGTHDILIDVKTNSIRDVYHLINEELKIIDGIESVDILFIDKINKYT